MTTSPNASGSTQEPKTLWVGDVENWMDESYIANLFCKFGPVQSVKIIRDKNSGTPMGYGFVEFGSHEIAARVLQLLNGSNNPGTNKPFRLNWGYFGGSTNKSTGQNVSQGNQRGTSNSRRPNPSDNNYQIYVGDLDLNTNKQVLMDHFKKKYGSVVDAKIITDPTTRISKGFGFVIFSSYDESQKAITDMQGSLIKGKPIKVSQGFSRNSGNNNPSSNSRSNSSNPTGNNMGNSGYGQTGYGGQNQGRGSILGGLGVQFKPSEQPQQMFIPPNPYGYMPNQPQQSIPGGLPPGQMYQTGNNQNLYAQHLASQQQLLYSYHQALGKAGQPGVHQNGLMGEGENNLHGMGIPNPQMMQGMYNPNQFGMMPPPQAYNDPQFASQFGYQFYMPNPHAMQGQPMQQWTAQTPKEDVPQVTSIKNQNNKQHKQIASPSEEIPLEIQSNNKLAVLNFSVNYDPKKN